MAFSGRRKAPPLMPVVEKEQRIPVEVP